MANDPFETISEIRGMRFPQPFIELWTAGQWEQPSEHLIQSLIPCLDGPIEFIEEMDWMVLENSGHLADSPEGVQLNRAYHGSESQEKPDLPWLDVDQALFVAVNRLHGDDLGIAIDFRTSLENPRVVASRWCYSLGRIEWELVTNTFTEFLERLEMIKT